MAGRPLRTSDLAALNNLTPVRIATIMEHLDDGLTLGEVARRAGVGRGALTEWLEQDVSRAQHYIRARTRAASKLAEDTIAIADGGFGVPASADSGAVVGDGGGAGGSGKDGAGNGSCLPAAGGAQTSDAARDKLRIQARQWLAARWDRKTYGEAPPAAGVTINVDGSFLASMRRVQVDDAPAAIDGVATSNIR